MPIITAAQNQYPINTPFQLTGSGVAGVSQWILTNMQVVSGALLSNPTITVMITSPGVALAQFGQQNKFKTPMFWTAMSFYGTGGTTPDCNKGDTCPTGVVCDCPVPTSKPKLNTTCQVPATFKTAQTIAVDSNFKVTLFSQCQAVQTLGGELNLCFYRPNGTEPALTNGIPLGTGGGNGARLGLYRQLTFDNPTSPKFAIVNGSDGSQTAYYYSFDQSPGVQVWQPGAAFNTQLVHTVAAGQWQETSYDRTYFNYDSNGLLYQKSKLNGGQVYYYYDTNNRVQTIAGDMPTSIYFQYDTNSNLSQLTEGGVPGQSDRVWTFQYQNLAGLGNTLSQINAPAGCSTYFGYDAQGQVLLELDSLNYATYYEYTYFTNAGWGLSKAIPPDATPTFFGQNALTASMQKLVQEPNIAVYYTHDPMVSRVKNMVLGIGATPQQWNFDTAANNQSTVDRIGRITYFAYDINKNVIRQIDPLGNSTYFAFDSNNRQIRSVAPRWPEANNFTNFTTYYVYDSLGNQIQSIDPLNETTLSAFNRGGLTVQSLDPRGNATYYGYDVYGRQTKLRDALGFSPYYGYDAYGNRTSAVSKRWIETGNFAAFTSYYQYDQQNRPIQTLDAVGNLTETDYSSRCQDGPIGQFALVQNLWRSTYFEYDGIFRLKRTVDALANVQTRAYAGQTQQVTRQTDNRGFPTYFGYDGQERQIATADALNNSTYFGYDSVSNQTQMVAPRWSESSFNNFTTYYGYDALDRRVQMLDPVKNSTYYGYDAAGNQKRVVGPRWQESTFAAFTTYYEYDAVDRQTLMIDALAGHTYFGYDADSNRISSQDPRGNTTLFSFDAMNRQTAMTDPLGNVSRTGYDANGNQVRMQDPLLNTTYFEYDPIDRQTASIDALNEKVYFEYDAANNRVKQIDHLTSSSFALTYYGYDMLNRLTKQVDAIGRATYYEYDPNGNQTRVLAPGSTVEVTSSGYDPLNRLTAQLSPFGASTYFGYDAASNRTQLLNARGLATYFGYDPLNRSSKSLDALQGATYMGYDAAGNATRSVGVRWKETGSLASFTTYYQYDTLNRLTNTIDPVGSPWLRGYDADGNLIQALPPVSPEPRTISTRRAICCSRSPIRSTTSRTSSTTRRATVSSAWTATAGTGRRRTAQAPTAEAATSRTLDTIRSTRLARMMDGEEPGGTYFGATMWREIPRGCRTRCSTRPTSTTT